MVGNCVPVSQLRTVMVGIEAVMVRLGLRFGCADTKRVVLHHGWIS